MLDAPIILDTHIIYFSQQLYEIHVIMSQIKMTR